MGTNLTVAYNEGAMGTLSVTDSIITITSANNYAGLRVGSNAGYIDNSTVPPTITKTTGIATFGTGSKINLSGPKTGIQVGKHTNTDGTLTFENGAQATLTGAGVWLNVGQEAGSEGVMNITSGTDFTMQSNRSGGGVYEEAWANIGRWGQGELHINSAQVTLIGPEAGMNIGREAGSVGTFTVTNNSNLTVESTGSGSLCLRLGKRWKIRPG